MAGNSKGSIPVLGSTKGGKKGAAPLSGKTRTPPRLTDIPSLRVRLAPDNREAILLNIPCNDSGIDLVLFLIATHPDAWGVTREQQPHIRFGDILHIGCPNPNDGWVDTADAKKETPSPSGSYRHIRVRTGRYLSAPQASRANAFIHPSARTSTPSAAETPQRPEQEEEYVGIVNIPDSEIGLAIMEEIYRDHLGDDIGAYTLFTTDFGHIPIKELARANALRK